MQAWNESETSVSLTQDQHQQVLAELDALLASPLFRQSKRYPAFLRYVVESTLRGTEEELKERTIGIEVFGRLPHYDTSLDPTVRLTAAEVRKRLAQFYQQPEHTVGVQIALHPGSYVPSFLWPQAGMPSEAEILPAIVAEEAAPPMEVAPAATVEAPEPELRVFVERAKTASALPWLMAATGVALLAGGVVLAWLHFSVASSARNLWSPLLRDPNPISLVLPDLSKAELIPPTEENASTTVISHIRYNRLVDFNDSVTLAELAGILSKRGKPYTVVLSSDTTFEDLQAGPSILIGAVDNPWTMRFLQPLPYSVLRRGDTMTFDIVGRDHAATHGWSIDLTQPFESLQQDYGILVRQTDTMTGQPVLIVAGIGQNGTAAGIRLLADPTLLKQITSDTPKGWSGRNLEIVYRTQIIADKFGPPVIVAREYW